MSEEKATAVRGDGAIMVLTYPDLNEAACGLAKRCAEAFRTSNPKERFAAVVPESIRVDIMTPLASGPWEFEVTQLASIADDILMGGWEPYAVVVVEGREKMWFRRRKP